MDVKAIFSYLVHPGKHEATQLDIKGTAVPDDVRVWRVMADLFMNADKDCEIGIAFTHARDGKQQNECRDDLIQFIRKHDYHSGHALASRLQAVTTKRSGLGLLFLAYGKDKDTVKVLLSRFPAEEGILADEAGGRLSITYVDRVFMKSWKTYKAAVYSGTSHTGDFWFGKAIDKQISERATGLTNYWVDEFLLSRLRTPGRVGTKRFALALKEAARHASSLSVHDELAALSKLVLKQKGSTSVSELLEKFNIDGEAKALLSRAMGKQELIDEKFFFDAEAYAEDLAYRSIQLDTGALMTAEVGNFDSVFRREKIRDRENSYRFTAEGTIEGQRFKKSPV